MEQLHLFTGDNAYEMSQNKQRWKEEFSQKYGKENMSTLDAKTISIVELITEVSSAPFLAEKRLILIDGLPKADKEDIERLAKAIHPQVVVSFFVPVLDKRLSASKKILSIATVHECKTLNERQVSTWLTGIAKEAGLQISPSAQQRLITIIGPNQLMLHSEVQKLSLFANGRELQEEDIVHMIVCSGERQIWALMDLMAKSDTSSCLKYVQSMYQQGESPQGVWGILLWMCANLTLVYAAVADGVTSPPAIVKRCSVSFGSAKSFSSFSRGISQEKMTKFVQFVSDADTKIKTGQYRATVENDIEQRAIIDSVLLRCCSLSS